MQASTTEQKHITVAGAGLVGALFALLRAQKGYRVSVYEKRGDLRQNLAINGRSINLALSDRGRKALEKAGIAEAVLREALPMRGRMIHDGAGHTAFSPYGRADQAIYSVSRRRLNEILLNAAEATGLVELNFNHEVRDFDTGNGSITLHNTATGMVVNKNFEVLIGADGSSSAVRSILYSRVADHRLDQPMIEHGYKELTIPPAPYGTHRMHPEALHIWPRKSFMLIALPNTDGSFTCTLFLPLKGPVSFENLDSDEKVVEFFRTHFPDALSLMPDLPHDYSSGPVSTLSYVRCRPYGIPGKVLLIGDAAHAIVPFYGQGMNAGFEDCTILEELYESYSNDFREVSQAFITGRPVNADAICELALQNFIEMRDLVADPEFILKKKIEAIVDEHLGSRWIPQYSMVTFSHIPYSEALIKGAEHKKIIETLISELQIDTSTDPEFPSVKQRIINYINANYRERKKPHGFP